MQTKLCKLDIIPTKLLKEYIEKFIGLLTNIANIPLESDVFTEEWKTSLLHPLIKRGGLDVIKYLVQSQICHLSHSWLKKLLLVNLFSMWITMD